MGSMNNNYVYKDKPVFGLDIGFSTIKAMQIENNHRHTVVTGYGVGHFDPAAIKDGIILDYEVIAKAVYELFDRNIIGAITTKRVVFGVPAVRTFNRTMTLPKLNKKELAQAVHMEAEQYIPLPADDLYLDNEIIRRTSEATELLVVAVPKKLIDSYLTLAQILGLEVAAMETTIGAASRLFVHAEQSDVPTVLIDFGSVSADVTIYDKQLIVTGTVPSGGDSFTDAIASKLGVTRQEAHIIKTKYGMSKSKKQAEINEALKPNLDLLLKEIRRMIRYYEERAEKGAKISQIITMGGGANMPGLSEFMTDSLRMSVRMCDPWQHLYFSNLQPPNQVEKSMYVTVAGLAMIHPREIFT